MADDAPATAPATAPAPARTAAIPDDRPKWKHVGSGNNRGGDGKQRSLQQSYPIQVYLQPDRRLGDRDNRTHWQTLPADELLSLKPNSSQKLPKATTKSGQHLSSNTRTHYGGPFLRGGGKGPGGPRDKDDAASVGGSSVGIENPFRAPTKQEVKTGSKKTRPSPAHGFNRTFTGGYYCKDGISDVGSRASTKASSASNASIMTTESVQNTRQGRKTLTMAGLSPEAAAMNLPRGCGEASALDRIKGYSRKPEGGYWKDRDHLDPAKGGSRSSRTSQDVGKHSGGHRNSESFFFDKTPLSPMHSSRMADTSSPGPGFTRTQFGGYYKRENRYE